MISDINRITVFEHEKIFVHSGTNRLPKNVHLQLEKYYGSYSPFFSLIRDGVQFNEYVGVLQVGKYSIEVLPKADKDGEEKWRAILIGMIQTIWGFEVKQSGNSTLSVRKNSILDLYFELFVNELERLLQKGLIKKYVHTEGNIRALKGQIHFAKNISHNLSHQERFYTKHTHYSNDHLILKILYKGLKLISKLNSNVALQSRIGSLFLNFPELDDIKVTEITFERIRFDRKNADYKTAVKIAQLLLLNWHPDISKGRNDVIALMFNMNVLWEQFVFITLKRRLKNCSVSAQKSRKFWKPSDGYYSKMQADIIIKNKVTEEVAILDTKWKNLGDFNPSPNDLRQMYVYHRYYNGSKTGLIYPGHSTTIKSGNYVSSQEEDLMSEKNCSLIFIEPIQKVTDWQNKIHSTVDAFLNCP